MPAFGAKSSRRLSTCHEHIQEVMEAAIRVYDFSVIWGYRGKARQNRAFANGFSRVQWPDSWHSENPSLAVDTAPYPIDWTNIDRFKELAWVIKGAASCSVIPLEWGGEWKFKDYAHWQLPRGYV